MKRHEYGYHPAIKTFAPKAEPAFEAVYRGGGGQVSLAIGALDSAATGTV
jgi:hypothetical protein